MLGMKTPVALIGGPDDVAVKNLSTGKVLKVKNVVATGTTSRNSETDYTAASMIGSAARALVSTIPRLAVLRQTKHAT